MKILVNDNSGLDNYNKGEYVLEIDDNILINAITAKEGEGEYWYCLIDGQLFKADSSKGIKNMFFKTLKRLQMEVSKALYWRTKIVPHIGYNCGYNTDKFYEDLILTHKVEFKKIVL